MNREVQEACLIGLSTPSVISCCNTSYTDKLFIQLLFHILLFNTIDKKLIHAIAAQVFKSKVATIQALCLKGFPSPSLFQGIIHSLKSSNLSDLLHSAFNCNSISRSYRTAIFSLYYSFCFKDINLFKVKRFYSIQLPTIKWLLAVFLPYYNCLPL